MFACLRQSTAATIKLGPFVDATDGATAETGLTISQADIRISKDGGDFAQSNNSAGATHDENGYYDVPLNANDTGTLGRLRVCVKESGARPVWQDFMVMPANVWDSMFGGDKLQVDMVQVGGEGQSGYDIGWAVRQLVPHFNLVGSTGNTTTTVNLAGVGSYGDDELNDCLLVVYDVTNDEWHSRWIEDYDGATKLATIAALPFAPSPAADDFWAVTSIRRGLNSADAQSAASAALSAYDPPTKAELDVATAAVTLKDGSHGGSAASFEFGAGGVIGNPSGHGLVIDSTYGHGLALGSSGSAGVGLYVTGDGFGPSVLIEEGSQGLAVAVGGVYTNSVQVTGAITADHASNDIRGIGLAAAHNVYHADINVAIDNLDTQDEYTVTWFKNGARVTADVASPFKLTVIDRSDNSALLDNVDLAELATDTGILWKNEGTDRLEPGNAYVVIVSATIDSATRSFSKLVSRDAEA